MFYHRVLPPPSYFKASSTRSSSTSGSEKGPCEDSIDQTRMTIVADRSPVSNLEHGHQRIRTDRDQVTRHQHQQVGGSPVVNPIAVRSSVRLSEKTQRPRSSLVDKFQDLNRPRQSSSEPEIVEVGQASPSKICICQPDPKVPRPRNAFILFRQHHQAAVVSQNPGLANPDISKIIGNAWGTATDETKDHWKQLAEEEKVRHQKQYPDYRYQPRRSGRNSLSHSSATDSETQLCGKCGGRSMQMHNSLPTPGTPVSPQIMPSNSSMGGNTILSRGSRFIGSPSYPSGHVDTRRPQLAAGESDLSLRQRESIPQAGPELKRKRYDGPAPTSPHPVSSGFPLSFSQPGRRPSMPHPAIITRGHSASVSRPPLSSGHPTKAPGPMLAPLQVDKVRDAAAQGKAIEAMVMSIPALRKIKVLSQISPPLPMSGPASPPYKVRGALIAIEGSDDEAIKVTANYLKDYLERDSDYKVHLFLKHTDMTFTDISSWLKTIMDYHADSQEIVRYITTGSLAANQNSTSTTRRSSESSKHGSRTEMDHEDEEMVMSPDSPQPVTNGLSRNREADQAIPIMIVPKYQLYLTDLAASQIPINDEYSPTDHWQWMATLWRGIIGPDVTIVVRTSGSSGGAANEMQSKSLIDSPMATRDVNMTGASTSSSGSTGGAVNQGSNSSSVSPPAVDIRLQEARVVFLHGKTEGKLNEAGLRRMAFEVGEWSRDIESRERERDARDKVR